MQVCIRIFRLFLAAVLGIAAIPSEAAADPVADLVRQSGFIFRGTVLRQGEATMPGVPVDAATTVVKVQEVLYTPPGLDDFTGRTITVQLAEPGLVRVGEPAAFFTRTWIFGSSLAVRAAGVLPVGEGGGFGYDPAQLKDQVAKAVQKVSDETLLRRLDAASWVVVGKVVSAAPARVLTSESPEITEHEPDWWIARVAIESVEKGTGRPSELEVLFPHSDDVAFYRNPKLSPGQESLFILHEDQMPKRSRGLEGLTALDPLDVQELGQLPRIRLLLQGGGK
jgi:hypothetical protein